MLGIEMDQLIFRCDFEIKEQKTLLFHKCLLKIKNLLQESNVSVGYHVTGGRKVYEMSKM